MSDSPVTETGAPIHTPVRIALSLVATWIAWFDRSTGAIVQMSMQSPYATKDIEAATGWGSVEVPAFAAAALNFVAVADYQATHFVDTASFHPQIRERTACPAALDDLTLRGLPLPCRIEITVPLYAPRTYDEADASEVDLSFDHPGTYTVRVLSAPHLPGVFTVTV